MTSEVNFREDLLLIHTFQIHPCGYFELAFLESFFNRHTLTSLRCALHIREALNLISTLQARRRRDTTRNKNL
jgi:hypothetical protein